MQRDYRLFLDDILEGVERIRGVHGSDGLREVQSGQEDAGCRCP